VKARSRRWAGIVDGKVRFVIIWLNGTFGAGKTTTAALLTEKRQRLRLFDPESVGYMLRPNLTDYPVTDFRHWEPWRVLTPFVADELMRFSGRSLVAPQTVLEENYWDELEAGLSARGHEVLHVLLEAEENVLRGRIEADQVELAAKPWRLGHLSRYACARRWIVRRADLVVDTTHLTPEQIADRIWDVAAARLQ
jgi:hypothetical protein